MNEFLAKALSDAGEPSSKRLTGFIAFIFFLILISVCTGYCMVKASLEENLVTILGFAAGSGAVPLGLASWQTVKINESQTDA